MIALWSSSGDMQVAKTARHILVVICRNKTNSALTRSKSLVVMKMADVVGCGDLSTAIKMSTRSIKVLGDSCISSIGEFTINQTSEQTFISRWKVQDIRFKKCVNCG